jgi:hypothetical protein
LVSSSQAPSSYVFPFEYHVNIFPSFSIAAENPDTTISVPQPALDSQPPSVEHDAKEPTEETTHKEVKRDLTEEDIADVLVGHAEVLKGTTIG